MDPLFLIKTLIPFLEAFPRYALHVFWVAFVKHETKKVAFLLFKNLYEVLSSEAA